MSFADLQVLKSHRYPPLSESSSYQSPHPSPGVQLRGGNRQIRTTVPPLARGVTPVIACSYKGGGGGLLGRVQRRDVPDLQCLVSAAAHSACTPAPLVAAPLAPDGPTLPLTRLAPASGGLLDGTAEHTKAKVDVPVHRREPAAVRRTAVPGVAAPAAAPVHPDRA